MFPKPPGASCLPWVPRCLPKCPEMLLRFLRCSPEEVLGGLPDASQMLLTSQMFPRFPLDASQMPPRCIPDASLMFLGCLLPDASNSDVSPQMPHPRCVPQMPPLRCLFPDAFPQMFPRRFSVAPDGSQVCSDAMGSQKRECQTKDLFTLRIPHTTKSSVLRFTSFALPPRHPRRQNYSGAFLYSLHERE